MKLGNGFDESKQMDLKFADATLKVANVYRDVMSDGSPMRAESTGCSVSVPFTSEFGVELPDPSCEMLYFQDFGGWRLPTLKVDAFEILADGVGIECIGFATLEDSGGEMLDGLGIDDHDVDVIGLVKRQSDG